jgi:hypothetical protein
MECFGARVLNIVILSNVALTASELSQSARGARVWPRADRSHPLSYNDELPPVIRARILAVSDYFHSSVSSAYRASSAWFTVKSIAVVDRRFGP